MRTKSSPLLLTLLLSLTHVIPSAADDWPVWSGPNHDLTAAGDGLFAKAGFGLETAWSRDLGSAYSGIVVAGERVITFFAEGESDVLVALDAADGNELWRYRVGDVYKGHDGSDDGALSTPAVHGDTVYGLGPWGDLFALRLEDGKELWAQKITAAPVEARKPYYGFTTHPTMVAGVLVVETGGEGRAVTGFDPDSGKVLWTAATGAVDYQAPMALDVGGESQVLAVTKEHVFGLEPRSGKELWRHGLEAGDDAFAQPIPLGAGKVLLTDWAESTVLQVSAGEDGPSPSEVWKAPTLRGSYAIPVPYEGHLYGYAGSFLTCVDAATGETVWKSREPGKGHLVLVDGHLVILAESGELVVAAASAEGYREKTRTQVLESGYLTAPAFAGGRFYVRDLARIASVAVLRIAQTGTPLVTSPRREGGERHRSRELPWTNPTRRVSHFPPRCRAWAPPRPAWSTSTAVTWDGATP